MDFLLPTAQSFLLRRHSMLKVQQHTLRELTDDDLFAELEVLRTNVYGERVVIK